MQPFIELLDRKKITIEGGLADRIVEPQLLEPCQMPRSPVMLRLPVHAVAPEQELAQPMPRPQQVRPSVIAATTQVAQCLFALAGRMDLGQESGSQQLGELAGIASIGLDPRPRLDRGQRRCDDLADHPGGLQLPMQRISGGTRLVTAAHLARRLPK